RHLHSFPTRRSSDLKEAGQSVGADAIIALSGFAPPNIHATAARLASGMTRRLFNLVVTNVPGPQFPLYAAGARMLEAYPVVPLRSEEHTSELQSLAY